MTRKEAIQLLYPDRVHGDFIGGVYGCPHGTVAYKGKLFYFYGKDYIKGVNGLYAVLGLLRAFLGTFERILQGLSPCP